MAKPVADDPKNFAGALLAAFFAIAIILYIIYKFITEILIPFLVGVLLVILVVVLIAVSIRLLGHLIAYLTLKKRYHRKITSLSKKIFQLEARDSALRQRMSAWSAQEKSVTEADLLQDALKLDELKAQRQNSALALADHLANRLDKVNRLQKRISGKTGVRLSDRVSQRLEKQVIEASSLESKINRLRKRYHIEPDPPFERKKRMYPMISGFDRFVSRSLKRCVARKGRA